jgi:DNA-binding GntR family transcriptional regulator
MRHKIVTLEFVPGMKIEEKYLMEQIGVGRTPLREALKVLISEGLVVSYGANAIYVKEISLKSAKELFDALYFVGDLIFNLASFGPMIAPLLKKLGSMAEKIEKAVAERRMHDFVSLNADFHKTLGTVARNEYLQMFLTRLYCEEMRLSYAMAALDQNDLPVSEHYRNILKDHREFIDLLEKGAVERLKEVYRRHLSLGQRKLFLYFTSKTDTFES